MVSAVSANIGVGLGHRDPVEGLALADEMLALAEKAGSADGRLLGRWYRIACYLQMGDIPNAGREIETHSKLAEESRSPYFLYFIPLHGCMRALLDGRWGDAERRGRVPLGEAPCTRNGGPSPARSPCLLPAI